MNLPWTSTSSLQLDQSFLQQQEVRGVADLLDALVKLSPVRSGRLQILKDESRAGGIIGGASWHLIANGLGRISVILPSWESAENGAVLQWRGGKNSLNSNETTFLLPRANRESKWGVVLLTRTSRSLLLKV